MTEQPAGTEHPHDVAPAMGEDSRHAAQLALPREARPYQGQRAGIVTRVVANVIDASLSFGIVLGCYLGYVAVLFLANPVGFSWPAANFAFFLFGTGAVLVAVFTVSWATSGRTLGDRVMGLRVVNFRGDRLRWSGSFVRAVFCTVVPIGIFWIVVSPTNRTWQDTVMRTSCIYDWIDQPHTPRSAPDAHDPPPAG